MKRVLATYLVGAGLIGAAVLTSRAAGPACDPNNDGITVPQGFCVAVVAENLGIPRHLAVAPNGDVFVSLQSGRGGSPAGGVVALRDADGDGKFEMREKIGDQNSTGIGLRNGYLYIATPTSVLRYKMPNNSLKPAAGPETVVDGLPAERQHEDKGLAFDGRGSLYVNVGAPSNACQQRDRTPKSPGQDPCPILEKHGGIWKFDENKLGQKLEDGKHYATGMRQMPGLRWHDGALYVVMHGRDQLNTMWPGVFTQQQNAQLPSETLLRVDDGSNFGWPYCYHDWMQNKLLLNPEYGGDGKKTDRCTRYTPPLMGFPGHWAPNDVMFYSGSQFPQKYRGGAFIAFHGSWNRAPEPQAGYNVTFVPFSGDKPSGSYEVFASGFGGPMPQPNSALARPNGLGQAPDGSLYVATDGQQGRLWRVMYRK
jgi:glucose/arabinose dehydrogenase